MKITIFILALLFLGQGQAKSDPEITRKSNALLLVLEAEFSLQQGGYAKAYYDYLQVMERYPSKELARRLLEVSVRTGNNQWQERALFESLRFDAENIELNQFYLSSLVKQNKEKQAKVQAKKLLTLVQVIAKHDYEPYATLANILAQTEGVKLAETLFEFVVAEAKHSAAALHGQAFFYRQEKKYAKALKAVLAAQKKQDHSDVLLLLHADILYNKGDKTAAISLLSAAKPDADFKIETGLAVMLVAEKRYEEAIKIYQRLRVQDQMNWAHWTKKLGEAYVLSGSFVKAKATYATLLADKTLSIDTHNYANYYLGLISEDLKAPKEAVEYYKKIKQGTYEMPAKIRHANLIAIQDKAGALAVLDSVSSMQLEDFNQLLMARAGILKAHNEWEKVYALYSSALEIEATDDLYYARALVAEHMGKISLMEKDFLEIINRNENSVEALNALGYSLAVHTTRYKEARDYIKRALVLEPDAFHILDSMGWVSYKLEDYKSALAYLKKAFEVQKDPEVAAHLAVVLKASGNLSGSKSYLEQALRLNKDNPTVLEVQKMLAE